MANLTEEQGQVPPALTQTIPEVPVCGKLCSMLLLASPVPFVAALGAEGALYKVNKFKLRIVRIAWFAIFLACYYHTQTETFAHQAMMGAVRQAVVWELFPEDGKLAERTKIGAASCSSTAEVMNAGDITSLLNAMTSFCKNKAGTIDVLKDAWSCTIFDLHIGEAQHEGFWDPVENRDLPTQVGDNYYHRGLRGILQQQVTPEDTARSGKRKKSLNGLCSPKFLQQHLAAGDDPIGYTTLLPADFNNMAQFKDNYLVPNGIEGLSDDFDGNSAANLDEIPKQLKELKDQQAKIIDIMDHFELKLESSAPTQVAGSKVYCTDCLNSTNEQSSLSTGAPQTEGPGSQRMLTPRLMRRPKRSHSQDSAGAKEEDHDLYGTGCFEPADISAQLREYWIRFDKDVSLTLDLAEATALVEALYIKPGTDMLRTYFSDGAVMSLDQFITFAEMHIDYIQVTPRGVLTSKCRNHHFGLIGLCKPDVVEVRYQIRNILRNKDGTQSVKNNGILHVDLMFNALTDAKHAGTGWYTASINIDSTNAYGVGRWSDVISMICTLLLASLLLIGDVVLTIAMWPLSLWRLLRMRFADEETPTEARTKMHCHLIAFMDFRRGRSCFQGIVTIMIENFLAIVFVSSIIGAWKNGISPFFLPHGVLTKDCALAYLEAERDWIQKSLHGIYAPRGLSPLQYIQTCSNFDTERYLAELGSRMLFQSRGRVMSHSLALGIVLLRLLEILDVIKSLRWFPTLVRVAGFKILNFLIAYALLVLVFALAMHLEFGNLYIQFSSITGSFIALVHASMGDTTRALQSTHSYVETTGTQIYHYLLIYIILAVTISMNVFTTIVLAGFSVSTDPELARQMTKDAEEEFLNKTAEMFGWKRSVKQQEPDAKKNEDSAEDSDERTKRPRRGSHLMFGFAAGAGLNES